MEHNTKLLVKYLNKFNSEGKIKMLAEISKFIGIENLSELLKNCMPYIKKGIEQSEFNKLIAQVKNYQAN